MRIKEGTDTSFALVSGGGLVLGTYDAASETKARDEAGRRRVRLFRITTTAEELQG